MNQPTLTTFCFLESHHQTDDVSVHFHKTGWHMGNRTCLLSMGRCYISTTLKESYHKEELSAGLVSTDKHGRPWCLQNCGAATGPRGDHKVRERMELSGRTLVPRIFTLDLWDLAHRERSGEGEVFQRERGHSKQSGPCPLPTHPMRNSSEDEEAIVVNPGESGMGEASGP